MVEAAITSTVKTNAPVPASAKDTDMQAGADIAQYVFAIQPKLFLGAPEDPLEHEADAVADRVMRMPEQSFLQRKCDECKEDEKVQRLADSDSQPGITRRQTIPGKPVSKPVQQAIDSSRGGGEPMDTPLQSFMESRFGASLGAVRIHNNSQSTLMAQALNAKAFTVGHDIYFNKGKYNPGSSEGRQLVAHELVHTFQQGTAHQQVQRDPITLPEVTVVGDAQFYHRALRSNRYYEQHTTVPGWPYLTHLRSLWAARAYDDFADAVRDYQEQVMHIASGDGILGPGTAQAMSVPGADTTTAAPVVPTTITLEALQQNADWLERRVLGVGIFGWGGPFRLDLEINAQGYPTRSIFLPRAAVSLVADPLAGHLQLQLGGQVYPARAAADEAIRTFPYPVDGGVVYAFYRGEENIIFPTIISESTAPHLMRVLRLAVRQEGDDARAASGLLIQSFLLAAGLRAPVTAGGATAPEAAAPTVARGAGATAAASGAVNTLRAFFANLLRTRTAGSITVEGVQFGNVRVVSEAGNVLRVTRASIENVGRVPGQGRVMAEAFEQAAVQVGREGGASSVRVSVEMIVNAEWRTYLMSRGYQLEQIITTTESGGFVGMQNVWTKIFTL